MIQRSNITSIIEDMQTSGYNSFAYWIPMLLEKYYRETIWAKGFGWMHLTQNFCDISFCERLVQLRIHLYRNFTRHVTKSHLQLLVWRICWREQIMIIFTEYSLNILCFLRPFIIFINNSTDSVFPFLSWIFAREKLCIFIPFLQPNCSRPLSPVDFIINEQIINLSF